MIQRATMTYRKVIKKKQRREIKSKKLKRKR